MGLVGNSLALFLSGGELSNLSPVGNLTKTQYDIRNIDTIKVYILAARYYLARSYTVEPRYKEVGYNKTLL